jgi:hypothetical protein
MTHLDFSDLNIWAILVAGVINMVIGALWYSRPLFGNQWMAHLGIKEEELNPSPGIYVVVFLLGLIIALLMALFLQGSSGALEGLAYGAVIGLGFVIPTILTHYIMERRKAGFMLIIAGHELVLFLAYGALLAGWQ